jgi:hypothetical protein
MKLNLDNILLKAEPRKGPVNTNTDNQWELKDTDSKTVIASYLSEKVAREIEKRWNRYLWNLKDVAVEKKTSDYIVQPGDISEDLRTRN